MFSVRLQRFTPAIGLLGFALLVGLVVHWVTRPTPPAPPPETALDPGRTTRDAGTVDGGYVGVVVNSSSIDLAPLADGLISSVTVRVGESVKGGQVLVTFESAELRFDLSMAQAEVTRFDADIERAHLERLQAEERLARAEKAQAHLNVEELSSSRYAASVAAAAERSLRAQRELAQAKVEQFKERLAQRILRAPADSVVSERYVDPGTSVQAGRPVLRLFGKGGWRVRFAVPEGAPPFAEGAHVLVHDLEGHSWPGTVTEVAPSIDPASLTRFVEAALLIDVGGPPYGARVRVLREGGRP